MTCVFDGSPMREVLVAPEFSVYECVASAHSVRVGAAPPEVKVQHGRPQGTPCDPLTLALTRHRKYGDRRICRYCSVPALDGRALCQGHQRSRKRLGERRRAKR